MTAVPDPDVLAVFDAELARILAACRTGSYALDARESRIVAAAFAQDGTPLDYWGMGVTGVDFARLAEDARWLLTSASIDSDADDPHRYRDQTRGAAQALVTYFTHLAAREHEERDLTQIYRHQFEFLRARGVTPYIAWTGVDGTCSALAAALSADYELCATNGDACLVGTRSDESPGPWSVGLYELRTGHAVAEAEDPCFATACATAVTALARDLHKQQGVPRPPALPYSRPPSQRSSSWSRRRVGNSNPQHLPSVRGRPPTIPSPRSQKGHAMSAHELEPATNSEVHDKEPDAIALELPVGLKKRDIAGLDDQGCVIIRETWGLVTLTACCHAYGKGSDHCTTGVCCRRCKREVDYKHAGGTTEQDIATPRDRLDITFRDEIGPNTR